MILLDRKIQTIHPIFSIIDGILHRDNKRKLYLPTYMDVNKEGLIISRPSEIKVNC